MDSTGNPDAAGTDSTGNTDAAGTDSTGNTDAAGTDRVGADSGPGTVGPRRRPRWGTGVFLGIVFYGWMYGTPLLLLLGLMMRVSSTPDWYLAEAYARTTRYFVAGLTLCFGAPVLGLVGAVASGHRRWLIRFGYALGCALLIGVLLSIVADMAYAPLFGRTVPPVESPPWRGCVAYSGGTNTCPGG